MIGLKIKAGALQLTLFVVVIITVLLSAFVMMIHTHKKFQLQSDLKIEATKNIYKGYTYILQNTIQPKDTTFIPLNSSEFRTLKGYKDYWGLFEKVFISSTVKNKTISKIALVGGRQPKTDRIALFLEEQNSPLVVVGETTIRGLSYLPKQGVKAGYISGVSYYGSQLIYGETKVSNTLPKLSKEFLEQIQMISNRVTTIESNQFLELDSIKSYQNSFFKPLKVIYSNSTIRLANQSITGHILIESKERIIIDATTDLKDVVLAAPTIEINDNVKGRFQAFATENISVGKNCSLEYPSGLVLNNQEKKSKGSKETKSQLKISENTNIEGVVICLGDEDTIKTQMYIAKNVRLTGELFCNKNIELLGTVYGTVFTSGFIANQSGSIYKNHLFNAKISISDLQKQYAGLMFENSDKSILKWLY